MRSRGSYRLGRLEAGTEAEALGVLPPSTRTKARVVEVQRFTRDELKVLHP